MTKLVPIFDSEFVVNTSLNSDSGVFAKNVSLPIEAISGINITSFNKSSLSPVGDHANLILWNASLPIVRLE